MHGMSQGRAFNTMRVGREVGGEAPFIRMMKGAEKKNYLNLMAVPSTVVQVKE